jgi:nucleoside-diphosphate-sugar epimerase
MRYLVTGANGYLGGWVCELLSQSNHEVVGLDSHNRVCRGRRPGGAGGLPYEDVGGHGFDGVVHLAWRAKPGDGEKEIQNLCARDTDILATSVAGNLYARSVPFIFASTVAVYGDRGDKEVNEYSGMAPACSYGRAKAEAEDGIRWRLPGSCILRLGSLYGLGIRGGRTRADVCINAFALEGWGRGRIDCWAPRAYKPIVHVRDAARVIVEALADHWQGYVNVAHTTQRAESLALGVATLVARSSGYCDVNFDNARQSPRSCDLNCDRLRGLRGLGLGVDGVGPDAATLELRAFAPGPGDLDEPGRWRSRP